MDKNVEFNRFKAETMCRLCEKEYSITFTIRKQEI